MKRVLAALVWAVACTSAPAEPAWRVLLVGDSTMATRTGYGDALCARFTPAVQCLNLARGGRSSSSYRSEGLWDAVLALLRDKDPAPTLVLIQFGHNDQPGKPGRSTDLATEFPANLSRYVAEVKALGAQPVLLTPLTRRPFRGPTLHNDLVPWADACRQVARDSHTPLLDLNTLSAAAVQAMGEAEADTLAGPTFDRTHLGDKGANLFSKMVVDELPRLVPGWAGALPSGPVRGQ